MFSSNCYFYFSKVYSIQHWQYHVSLSLSTQSIISIGWSRCDNAHYSDCYFVPQLLNALYITFFYKYVFFFRHSPTHFWVSEYT